VKAQPAPLLRDADRDLIAALAGRLEHRRTVEVVGGFYTAPEVQQQLADHDSQTRDRLAYMSGLVVAEVGLRRLTKAAVVALVVLCLTGCGETARAWNAGGSPLVTVRTTALVNHDYRHRGGNNQAAGSYIQAWTDRERWEIRLPDDVPRNQLVALAYHELGEAADDPGLWELLQAMATVQFPCGPDSDRTGSAWRQAAAAALAESRRAGAP
jgi:hypothetical protein